MRRLLARLLLTTALVVAAAAGPAHANPGMLSVMQDDDQLLYRGDEARDAALRRMRHLGVDYVRVTVLWSVVAEHARHDRRGRKRAKFRADDPSTYPRGNWDRYDRLVRAGRTLGVGIYFNVTGPGPSWAHKKPPRSQRRHRAVWKPKPREFFKFVKAVGHRYDGTYRDENDGRQVLPRVSFWSIYNEPNQNGWLMPQWEKRGSTKVAWSPVMYRELWYYGNAALRASGHGSTDIVLIGETAPRGSGLRNAKSPIYPKRFIRELLCIAPNNRPYTGSAAAKRKCSFLQKLGRFEYTAWAHHPYTKELPPWQRDRNRDSLTMANISELTALLDALAAKTGRLPATNASALTEFGYETDPPDRFSGISLADQAAFINVGDYLAYREPRVVANSQFMLRDADPLKRYRKNTRRYWFTYQSGLYYADGRPKPAAAAYLLPFHVVGRGPDSVGADGVHLWGQLRFLPDGVKSEVYVQFKPKGAAEFSTIGDAIPVTNQQGFWEAHRRVPTSGTWRAIWINPVTKAAHVSREASVNF